VIIPLTVDRPSLAGRVYMLSFVIIEMDTGIGEKSLFVRVSVGPTYWQLFWNISADWV